MARDVEIKQALHDLIEEGSPEQNQVLYWVAKDLTQESRITPGQPMTQQELVTRVMAAKKRITEGKGLSQSELEDHMGTW